MTLTIEDLETRVLDIASPDDAILIYLLAGDLKKRLDEVQKAAKDELAGILALLHTDRLETEVGQCYTSKPTLTTTIDHKAIKAQCPDLWQVLEEGGYVSLKERAGSLTIRALPRSERSQGSEGKTSCTCVDLLNGNPDPVVNPDCPIHGALRRSRS